MRFEGTLDIAAPRDRVWAFLTHPREVTLDGLAEVAALLGRIGKGRPVRRAARLTVLEDTFDR
jgi:hypothetical protein